MTTTRSEVDAPTVEEQGTLISADSHVVEPRDLWKSRLPVAMRELVPDLAERWGEHGGATVPSERLEKMIADEVSMEVLYPTYGLEAFSYDDPKVHEASCTVYNEWIAEYCAATPGRLVGIPMIPTYDIDVALAELKRSKEMGLRGLLVWHVPPPGLEYSTDHYDPLWAAASEMDEPVNLHILTGFSYAKGRQPEGVEHYRGSVEVKLHDAIHVLFDFIFYGVFDRFPDLKLVLVEFEVGWLAWVLQQWDFYVHRFAGVNPAPIKCLPSEYFSRQIFATFVNDGVGATLIKSGWGQANCMWSSDFPHGGTNWPNSRVAIAKEFAGADSEVLGRLLHGNVTDLYHLDPPPLSQP